MKIHAAILTQPNRPFIIEQPDLEDPCPGEVLVRIAATGVCHSDWHLASGATQHPMPVVAGHEGAGVVQALGPGVRGIKTGDHVVLNWAPACGSCFYCHHNQPNLCQTYLDPIWAGTMLDGSTRLKWNGKPLYHWCGLAAFAQYTVVPQQSCVVIRPDVPLNVAALVGCAIATGVGAVIYTANVRPAQSVAVFGCGGVGLSILQGAALAGAGDIIAVDTNPAKANLARQFGATHFLQANDATVDLIRELTAGRGADHAFEAVGLPHVQETAFAAVRPGGTLTLAGLSRMGSATNLPGSIIARQEKTIKGSYYGSVNPPRDFPMLLDLYMAGKLKLDEMVSHQWTLDQINQAFAQMLTGDVARGLIVF